MSYATPMAYKTNLLVMNAGNYRFADFVKVGVPLTLLDVGEAGAGCWPLCIYGDFMFNPLSKSTLLHTLVMHFGDVQRSSP